MQAPQPAYQPFMAQQSIPHMLYSSPYLQQHPSQGLLGASSHLNFNASNLSTIFDKRLFPSVHVGDDNSIPVTNTGHGIIPSIHRPLHLYNVLVTPNIIKNLIYDCQFARDNNCSIEFNAFCFSMKDFLTRHILLRCDSSGDLYPVTKPSTTPTTFLSTSASTWHQRLGHPGDEVLCSLVSRQFISCNKEKSPHICHACQLGKHVKLPFHSSDSIVEHCFDIIHFDLWTSPIHKFHADGTLSCYKARLVANGSSQQLGVDFGETFSSVVKPATIRTVLSLVVSRQWLIHQLDGKNAFLNEDLSEIVYMRQSSGYATLAGFYQSRCDSSLFTYRQGSQVAYLLIYVDDIILTASSPTLLQQVIDSLHNEFDMTDLRALNYFLGISAALTSIGLFLSQRKYALQLPECAHMVHCNPSQTLVDTESKLGPVQDPTLYRSLAGGYSILHLHVQVRVLHVASRYQYADIFTKRLPSALFEEFRSRKENGKPLVDSVFNGPFKCGTVTEAGTATSPATVIDIRYNELTDVEKIREAYDIKATNIVLQGLPQDIYNLVNHLQEAKHIWDRVKLFIEGSEISLQERESKLYDEFDMFTSMPGDTIHSYYLRFAQLINDVHTIYDNETNSNEVRIMKERFTNLLALVASTYNSSTSYTNQTLYHQQLSPFAQEQVLPLASQQLNNVPMV
ncbi:ribonuclease H-like domain-containing protein [Tanacetum coccineum]|uniref:Ribonuclease H-like domain-containing protein n=1 Tax=Tanacetum coccineum TaxID=301880 RepID=A0ABQ5IAW1_9ASTR